MTFKHLLFDLDNTLYPADSAMNDAIQIRMLECVADFFNCTLEEARALKKERIVHYSTTLEWLRSEGLTDVEGFLAHVHPEDEADSLKPIAGLREYLQTLPLPMSILTNSPIEHARRVVEKLGISDLFMAITDIRDAGFKGKPYSNSYLAALAKSGTSVDETLFLDDMRKYTDGWCALGGTSILVGDDNGKPLAADAKALEDSARNITGAVKTGPTIKMQSIYELKKFLEKC